MKQKDIMNYSLMWEISMCNSVACNIHHSPVYRQTKLNRKTHLAHLLLNSDHNMQTHTP